MTLGATGGTAGTGGAITLSVLGDGSVITSGQNSMGVYAQSVGGGGGSSSSNNVTVSSNSATTAFNLGASGGAGGNAGIVGVVNNATISTSGDNAVGLFAQSAGGGGGSSTFVNTSTSPASSITANFALGAGTTGTGATNGDGKAVTVVNGGSISTTGANAIGLFAQSIGGGGGYAAATMSAGNINLNSSSVGAQQGSAGNASDVSVIQNGFISTTGAGSIGIFAQSVGGGGGYLGIVSKDANATLSGGNNVTMGASSASGNGGNVTVTNNSLIRTTGANAIGILAQSVGGGGGTILVSGSGTISPTWAAGTGNGGNVTVNVNAPIYTSGKGAYGVVAESVGGGGGLAISGTSVTDSGGYGTGVAGLVTVNVNAPIIATGQGAIALYAHSISDPIVTIAAGQSVIATEGASAVVLDGLVNELTNYGSITGSVLQQSVLTDTALTTRGNGVTTVINNGLMTGNIQATSGSTINITNNSVLIAGATLDLGSSGSCATGTAVSCLTNNGTFASAASSTIKSIATTDINGSFTQSSTGLTLVRVDAPAATTDQFVITGNSSLSGFLKPVPVNRYYISPGTFTSNIISTGGTSSVSPSLTILDDSIIMSYSIAATSTGIALTTTANFTPAGMSTYGTSVGRSIGAMQWAGSTPFFGTITDRLVSTVSTAGQLDQIYNGLAGTAISAVPQVNYEAVNRGMANFSDRMNSWRVGDTYIAAAKNPRALMTNSNSANAPIIPGSTNDELPSSRKKAGEYKTWITPFQGDISSNYLMNRVYGGSAGLEIDSVDRSLIGGIGLTVSQSNFTYSNGMTPSTPGSATNYGASFYVGARNDDAYISAIGYFGGSNATFNRQLQTLGFSTSTNVNVHSTTIGGRVEAGYNMLPNPGGNRTVQLTPFVAFQPVQIRQNNANEYFTGYGAGFSYGSNSNTALPFFIGAELSGDFDLGDNAKFLPFLRISWVTDTASQATMNASYTTSGGPSIYSNGTPSFGNAMIYKVGAKYNLGRTISAYGTFDLEQGNKTYNYRGIGGTVGLRYSF